MTTPIGSISTMNIARGAIPGLTEGHKFGENPSVGTAYETLWPLGGRYITPTVATTMTVSSSSTDDTSAGTGLRTVRVEGLDANYYEISETVTLNGQTAVTLSDQYLRVNRVEGMSAGSGEINAGIIYVGSGTVTTGVPANKYNSISVGEGQSQFAFYTVPADKTAYIDAIYGSSGAAKTTEFKMYARPFGEIFKVKFETQVTGARFNHHFHSGERFEEKTDLDLVAKVDTGSAETYGGFEYTLEEKTR